MPFVGLKLLNKKGSGKNAKKKREKNTTFCGHIWWKVDQMSATSAKKYVILLGCKTASKTAKKQNYFSVRCPQKGINYETHCTYMYTL